jgi:calcineurin-like phosphoesterase family protein
MIYFTSDNHFWHYNILHKFQPNRKQLGSNIDEMNEELIRRWNETVKPEDEVYNLGDFAFQSDPDKINNLLSRLNGKKYFIYGNHDQTMKKHRDQLKHHFEWMRDYHELRHDGEFIVLCHFPFAVWNKMHHGAWHLHGHCHGSYIEPHGNRIVDVGIDSPHVTSKYEMRPFSFEEIKAYMSTRTFKSLDGHGG